MHKKCLKAYLKYILFRFTEGVRGVTACFIKGGISYQHDEVPGYWRSCSISSRWKYALSENAIKTDH